ncbi:DUF3015 family protein [Marinospirillum perlucidum]|uniref:DUF3015 family protein n=1 Tax=Marinospirillum perlucidum TaxID=1982602 RepID=UPI000DF338AB|nr:DUF3015 family protein [Marinospirillum perlucidum]
MKKILAAGALALTMPFAAQAAPTDAGCGLGSVLLADQDDTLVMNVLAVTLNSTSGNQTFGMTTGTLNCSQSNSLLAVQTYIDDNMDSLAMDAARGEGESLETLASVWGVEEADKADFIQATQANFAEIFSSEDVTSDEVLSNLNRVVSEDEQLAAYTLG